MQNLDNQTILITGTAGFIGSNLTKEIIHTASNVTVIGLDSVNDYYDVSLKEYRLNEILFFLINTDLINLKASLKRLVLKYTSKFKAFGIDRQIRSFIINPAIPSI